MKTKYRKSKYFGHDLAECSNCKGEIRRLVSPEPDGTQDRSWRHVNTEDVVQCASTRSTIEILPKE